MKMLTRWGTIVDKHVGSICSYDGSGLCFSFLPAVLHGFKYALDVEERCDFETSKVASALGDRGLGFWVEIEVVAKLVDIPAHLMLREASQGRLPLSLQRHRIELIRLDTSNHWIALGRRRV